jgi:hypothetical protein
MSELFIIAYLAGIACVGYAGDRRTCGIATAAIMAAVATPVVGAILILAWPSRDEYAYWNRDLIAGRDKLKQ